MAAATNHDRPLARYDSLAGKRVLVTGGGGGIGAAAVWAYAEQGARVAFVDIAHGDSLALCQAVADAGLAAPAYRRCDLTDVAALRTAFAALAAELGDFDILINNAANDQRHTLEEVTPGDWDRMIAVNQRPQFFACQALAPGMRRRGGGAIVNLGSIAWRIKSAGYPVYATAKAAVHGLTRGLARALGADRIRINTVSPGWVMTARQLALWVDAAAELEITRSQCLPDRLTGRDVAALLLFLTSDDGALCTAQEFIVDAGWS